MKKTRIITLIAVCAILFTLLTGCDLKRYANEKFYGVVEHSETFGGLLINIPGVGDVAIPSSERIRADFVGGESIEENYQLKAGDLVAISFVYERSWDDHGVPIMESYPAQFGRKATEIVALRENISFEKTESAHVLSVPRGEGEAIFSVGDKIRFVESGGKNGSAYKALIAEGTVTDASGGMLTVNLGILENEKEFIEKLAWLSLEQDTGE